MKTLATLPPPADTREPALLGVVAHPDDEVLCMPALLLHAAGLGWRTQLLVLTDGGSRERRAEVEESAALLGASVLHGGLDDGAVREHEARDVVLDMMICNPPTLLATMDLDGMYGHGDHVATTRGVLAACLELASGPRLALRIAPPERMGRVRRALKRRYPGLIATGAVDERAPLVDERPLALAIGPRDEATILGALACHRSQLPTDDPRSFLGGGVFAAPLPTERWRLGRAAGAPR
jgi:LmbE family N-acetylglucosaminyl deacetylase